MAIGIGPGNYRLLSEELLAGLPHLRAENHPHNFYIQMLAETGIVGALAGTAFLWAIIWKCFTARLRDPGNVVSATAFIVRSLSSSPSQRRPTSLDSGTTFSCGQVLRWPWLRHIPAARTSHWRFSGRSAPAFGQSPFHCQVPSGHKLAPRRLIH